MESNDKSDNPFVIGDDAPHLLVVDDDTRIRNLLKQYLTENGFRVTVAGNADEARRKLRGLDFDLLVLDVMMPGESGVDLTRSLREEKNVPILMLTALSETDNRITGLEAGADDYLPKPFAFAELAARVEALGRRSGPVRPPVLRRGDLELDESRMRVRRAGRPVELNVKEFGVLRTLMAADGAVVSGEELLRRVWDEHADPFTNTVRVTMMRLRRKLGAPDPIETVVGAGYRLP